MDTKENVTEEKGLAMELLTERKIIIRFQWLVIIILVLLNAAQSFYHDYQWSQFDTVVVDSTDGGSANYIGNDGDINNYGESGSTQAEEKEEQ